jgi:FkbM family methyltransferase
MMLVHKHVSEPITVEAKTKDRGKMLLDLEDLMQYPVYYNIFEAQYEKCIEAILVNANVILDVGANIGQYALYFASKGKKVYAFEPMPSMIEKLTRHISLNHLENQITLIPKALTSENGTLKFSLPKSENSGTASLVLGRSQNTDEIIEVEGVTLDTLIGSGMVTTPVDLIKIDIEGAELYALRGMQGLLSKEHKPVLILEMNEDMMNMAGYHPDDIVDFLAPFGYKAYELTKRGFRGPEERIQSLSENYAFLTHEHLAYKEILNLIYK